MMVVVLVTVVLGGVDVGHGDRVVVVVVVLAVVAVFMLALFGHSVSAEK